MRPRPLATRRHARARGFLVVGGVALALAACSSGGTANPAPTVAPTTPTTLPTAPTLPPLTSDPAVATALSSAAAPGNCDDLDARSCLLPFPSDAYTIADPNTDTGRRVAFPADQMIANATGTKIDVTEWNRNDGFSPNTPILTYIPGLDAAASKLPSWTDPSTSLAADSPVAVVDLADGSRVPVWAETDAAAASDADRLLVIHPAVPLKEGHRYAVALRHLVGAGGAAIAATDAFRVFRDRIAATPKLEQRRTDLEKMFSVFQATGIVRSDLQLAWDFTVASQRSIAERMLRIRDDGLKTLAAESTPGFTITNVESNPDPEGLIARRVTGTFTVPNFLTGTGGPGSGFYYGAGGRTTPDQLPQQNGTLTAPFVCNIPASVLKPGAAKAHLSLYGHGLLGSNDEINAGNVRKMASEYGVIFCATKWAGMSEDDIGNAVAALQDLSKFPTVADRLQQGVLNAIVLGKLMISSTGITTSLGFAGVPVDTSKLVYDGNSQGGIMGIMLTAVSPDIHRAVVGVAGMNYSLLLPRSVDFQKYEAFFKPAYPNDLDRQILLGMLQMLWDRGEGGGYVQHVTSDPYPATPAKPVLIDVALGDHQVSPLTALIAARAMGARYHQPWAAPGRVRADTETYGLTPIDAATAATTSAIVLWDSGSPEIPLESRPPSDGTDPHEDPRASADARKQKAAFLFDDTFVDVCNGAPCTAPHA